MELGIIYCSFECFFTYSLLMAFQKATKSFEYFIKNKESLKENNFVLELVHLFGC